MGGHTANQTRHGLEDRHRINRDHRGIGKLAVQTISPGFGLALGGVREADHEDGAMSRRRFGKRDLPAHQVFALDLGQRFSADGGGQTDEKR